MSGIEIVGSIALFWALGLVTWVIREKGHQLLVFKDVDSIKEKLKEHKDLLDILCEQKVRILERVLVLENSNDTVTKLADETKKLLNQNTISNAFVHKNKRTELT